MNTPTPRTDALRRDPRDSNDLRAWESLADTLERELAAALEARNAAVRRCAEIVAGLTANRNGVLATIRAEFPEAFK